jgi:hypothetical protein
LPGREAVLVVYPQEFGADHHFRAPLHPGNLSAHAGSHAIILDMSDDRQRIVMATAVMMAIIVIMAIAIAKLWIVP